MLRHPGLLLVAVALSPTLPGCAIDPGSGSDPGSEPAAQTSQAVGGTVQNVCGPPLPWEVPQIRSVEADPDGHVQVRICVPSAGDYFNILDTRVGIQPTALNQNRQYQNRSGTLDLQGIESGIYHAFQAEACVSSWGDTECSFWTSSAFVYNPFPATNWVDTDQVGGTAPYQNGFPTGVETLADGTRRSIFSCAVMFDGTTQIGKASASAPGGCWFGWAGGEQFVQHGMVLEGSSRPLVWQQWLPSAHFMGVNPVQGGTEPGNNEYICHAPFVNPITHLTDTLPGKTVGGTCNISWGSRELPVDPSTSFVEILNQL